MFHRHHLWQVLATIIISLGLMSDGMHFGWCSPATSYFLGNETYMPNFTTAHDTANQVLFLVAGICFTPLITYLVDKIGRKWTNIIASVLNFISWLLIGVTKTPEVICLANAFAGICYTFDMIVIPMYVAEISDKKIRGFLLGYVLASAMFGIFFIYVLFPHVAVYVSSAIGCSLHVVHIGVFVFFPKSPYFLLRKGKIERGTKSLKFFHGADAVEAKIAEVEEEIEIQNQQQGKVTKIFKDVSSRKALMIGCTLYFFVAMHCMSAVTMNLLYILGDTTILPKNVTPTVFSVSLLLAQITCMFIVDKFGRKPLLLTSLFGCQISLFGFSTFNLLRRYYPETMALPALFWIPETLVIVYAWCYRFGLGPIPTALCAELFPLNYKAAGMAISFVVLTLADGLVVFIYKQFAEAIDDTSLPFFLFAGIAVLCDPFVIFFVPETKDKSLEEIQQQMRKGKLRVDKNADNDDKDKEKDNEKDKDKDKKKDKKKDKNKGKEDK